MTRPDPAEDRRPGGARAAAELAALVRESVAANAARDVLHLRLAGLGADLRRPHHQRLLRDALEPALAAARTRVFDLPNGDVVAIAAPPAPALEAAAEALRRTLDLSGDAGLRRLRLPEAAAQLLSAAADSLGLAPERAAPAGPGRALSSAALAVAERDLAQADLEPVTTRHAVCRLDPEGAAPDLLWRDLRIDWPALSAAVLPGVALGPAPGLPARLARVAEARLLAELARPAAQLGWKPAGVALSPALVTGAAFRRFDAALPAGRRQEVTIGFRPADILADPAGFRAARDAARGRGYRLALDDAAPAALDVLPPERLGLDLIRLRWSPDLPVAVPPALARVLGAEDRAGRIVLAGVDRPAAIAWGWEAGIRQFQGALVERRWRAG
ncbi:hypothetical protein [Falsiroseomonas sp. CW058]|uniref:hypothetical protein n=1 Tax=Falsiroseomonas sp. CW058 TaxID=3388664 RepID=UPI003D314278